MPITENSFTAAEVQAAVTANPALLAELKTGLTPLGHHAIPKDEYATFIETERNKIAGEERSTIYGTLDRDVLEVTGIAKASGDEKTYDYVKRALNTYKAGETALKGEVATLKEKIASGSTDQATKDALAQAQADLKKYQEEEKPGYETQLFKKDVELEYALGIRSLKLRADLPKVLVEPALAAAKAELMSMAKKTAEGTIYFVDKDNKTVLDGTAPATAEFILKTKLAEILDTGKNGAGTGTGAPGAGGTGAGASTGVKNADGNDIVIPEGVKSKVELHEFLMTQGLSANSKEFNELYTKHGEKLPLRSK